MSRRPRRAVLAMLLPLCSWASADGSAPVAADARAAATDSASVVVHPAGEEPDAPAPRAPGPALVTRPVLWDGVPVFVAVGPDSAAADREAERVSRVLRDLESAVTLGGTLRLEERGGAGFVRVDSLVALRVGLENRVDTTSTPLANALALQEEMLRSWQRSRAHTWSEDELLLRLLLGIVFPISLLALLRMTRLAMTRWERAWRRSARHWLDRQAERRGAEPGHKTGRNIVRIVAGVMRLSVFTLAVVAMSLLWFALFPQTRPLAVALLSGFVAPFLDLLGGTARGGLHLVYSALVFLAAVRANAWIGRRRASGFGLLSDPLLAFPLRLATWVVAVFLVLLPYPGAPRLLGVGLVLLVLLGGLVAARPLIEEIAAGLYVHAHYDLRRGRPVRIDGASGVVVSSGLTHLEVAREDGRHSIPYSRVLGADVNVGPPDATPS